MKFTFCDFSFQIVHKWNTKSGGRLKKSENLQKSHQGLQVSQTRTMLLCGMATQDLQSVFLLMPGKEALFSRRSFFGATIHLASKCSEPWQIGPFRTVRKEKLNLKDSRQMGERSLNAASSLISTEMLRDPHKWKYVYVFRSKRIWSSPFCEQPPYLVFLI